MKNKRVIYLLVTVIIIFLGLASRKQGEYLPGFVAEYAGDTLWAAMVYFGLRFLFPSTGILKTMIFALLFSYAIEVSQLYQAEWINNVRNTTIGALVLGHGFLWTDLVCYTVGIGISSIADSIFRRWQFMNAV